MRSLISDYIVTLLSPHTKVAYRSDLEQAEAFLASHLQFANSEQLSLFRDALINTKQSPSTINRRFSALRSFYRWALRKGHVSSNPVEMIDLPKLTIKDPTKALMDDEAVKMMNEPDSSSFRGNMHRIAFYFLLYLGLRRSELVRLQFQDILTNGDHTYVRVMGKGGKYRRLPLNKILLLEIEAYKARFFELTGRMLTGSDYILQTSRHYNNESQTHPSTIYRIAKRYAEKIQINRPIGAHSCRATVISHLLDTKKAPIRDVADFAGHANTANTLIYDKKRKGMDDSAAYQVGY